MGLVFSIFQLFFILVLADLQKKVVHFFVHSSHSERGSTSKLPFTLMLEHAFQKKKINVLVKQATFRFGLDSLKTFLQQNGVEKNHYVCFDEIICKQFSKSFLQDLIDMKNEVAGLWLAIGAKSVIGRFSTAALERSGFLCPTLSYALRNPMAITQKAHEISQNGAKNRLDGILQNPIHLSSNLNINPGLLIKLDIIHSTYQEALQAGFSQIPSQKFAIAFIDDRQVYGGANKKDVQDGLLSRSVTIFDKEADEHLFQEWLCQPQNRRNDFCVIGSDHKCNGIETEIVLYVLPEDCPECEHSNEDPVIASRAKAMMIVSMYKRSTCPNCFFEQESEKYTGAKPKMLLQKKKSAPLESLIETPKLQKNVKSVRTNSNSEGSDETNVQRRQQRVDKR